MKERRKQITYRGIFFHWPTAKQKQQQHQKELQEKYLGFINYTKRNTAAEKITPKYGK